MFQNERDWSETNHPFVPQLIERIKKLRGVNRARALFRLAHAFWEEQEFVDAVEALDTAAEIFSKNRSWIEVAESHRVAAICLWDDALYEAALERLDLARQIFLDAGLLHEVADCDVHTALILHQLRRTEEALKRIDGAQAMFMETGHGNRVHDCIRLRTEFLNESDIG